MLPVEALGGVKVAGKAGKPSNAADAEYNDEEASSSGGGEGEASFSAAAGRRAAAARAVTAALGGERDREG